MNPLAQIPGSAADAPVTVLTVGIIAIIVGLLGVTGVKVYGWIRAQVKAERDEWEKQTDKALAEIPQLRAEVARLSREVYDLQNGKAKALQHLGRALGCDNLEAAKKLVDSAISALAPSV